MAERSSYVQYLPPVLWAGENESTPLLGRMLRIFEKILTGIAIDAQVVRHQAPFSSAQGQQIILVDPAVGLRVGDSLVIKESGERAEIAQINAHTLTLTAALAQNYTDGHIRLADLQPGQRVLHVERRAQLGPEVVITISQGEKSEVVVIEALTANPIDYFRRQAQSPADPPPRYVENGEFIILRTGLVNHYTLDITAAPVRLADSVPLVTQDHHYRPLETTIAELHRLFNPHQVDLTLLPPAQSDTQADAPPSAYLDWLASWVALNLRNDWSEAQRRKLIADIVTIYRQRGLKAGLLVYLDSFAVTKARPRIVIDAGEALFRARILENGAAYLHALAYCTNLTTATGATTALLRPSAVAVDSQNRYIIADQGDPQKLRPPAIWRISNTGAFEYRATASMPLPMPLYQRQPNAPVPIDLPVAIVVNDQDHYFVLDAVQTGDGPAILRYDGATWSILVKKPAFAPIWPVDMAFDRQRNAFVVLDRGGKLAGDPPSGPSKPALLVVNATTLAVETHNLFVTPPGAEINVEEPTALVVDEQGRYLVADAQRQSVTGTAILPPANLILIDPNNHWTRQALLPNEGNPLVFPTGLVFETPTSLLVCDAGLRRGYAEQDPSYRFMAEMPALYRIDLAQSPPRISKITDDRKLVYPTKLAVDRNGELLITDRGEVLRTLQDHNWRMFPYEFGVIVHFSRQRPLDVRSRRQIRYTIANMVEEQKPAHITYWMKP